MSHPIKFKDLDKLLKGLDFKSRFRGSHKIYCHDERGVLIVLPKFSPNSIVRPMHLAMVRRILAESDLLDKEEFESKFRKKHSTLREAKRDKPHR